METLDVYVHQTTVWLDGLQIEGATEIASIHQIQKEARKQLETICGNVNLCNIPSLIVDHEDSLTIGPFSLRKSPQLLENKVSKYSFQSQTISDNIRKIIRFDLFLDFFFFLKPIL